MMTAVSNRPLAYPTAARSQLIAFRRSITSTNINLIKSEGDVYRLLIFFLETTREMCRAFIREVRDLCLFAAFCCPRILVTTPGGLSRRYLGFRRRFKGSGAHCIVAGNPGELYASIEEIISEETCENGMPTIIVEREAYRTKFWLLGPAGRELIAIGSRQVPLVNYFAINFRTELSTVDLAEAADTALEYIRVYLERIRERFDEAAGKAGTTIAGKDVFCTFRKDGAFVYVLRARVLFT